MINSVIPMSFERRIERENWIAPLAAGLLAIILFHQFFLGRFTIAGTDLLFSHYPNFIFGYREFQEFGKFSLWNSYIFAGADFTGSMHAHYLNPLYWPLLFLPEKYVFHMMTFEFMVMNGLIGWTWFKIASHFELKGYPCLLVGIVAQAGMFFWFAMTTMIAVPMYAFASVACLLVLTQNKRSTLANYVALSLTFALITLSPHPAYILGFMLPVLGLSLFGVHPSGSRDSRWAFILVFIAAGLTALFITAYRLFPVYQAIASQGKVLETSQWLVGYANSVYLWITSFSPTAFGLMIGDAMKLDEMIGYQLRHTQFHNGLYFGIVPLILIYTSLRLSGSSRIVSLVAVAIAAQIGYIYAFQPVSDALTIIFYPFVHDAIFRIGSNFAVLFLLIFSIQRFDTIDPKKARAVLKEIMVIAGLILIAALGLYGRVFAHYLYDGSVALEPGILTNSFRLICVLIILAMWLCYRLNTDKLVRYRFPIILAGIGIFVVLLSDVAALIMGMLPGNEMVMTLAKNTVAVMVASLAFVLIDKPQTSQKLGRVALIFAVLASVALIVTIRPAGAVLREKVAALAAMQGWVVFIVLVGIALHVFARWAHGNVSTRKVWLLFITLTLVDLVSSFGIYSYVNIYGPSPYYKTLQAAYPKRDPVFNSSVLINNQLEYQRGESAVTGSHSNEPDFKSYRVNHISILSGFAGNEVMTGIASVYKMPTYAGVDSDLSKDYVDFLSNFVKPESNWFSRAGFTSSLGDERLLDLLGVGYDSGTDGALIFRPKAIPRLAAYSGFEVQLDQSEALRRLKEKDFDPTRVVLLSDNPDSLRLKSDPRHFQKLIYDHPDADVISVKVAADTPRVIVFNDRFAAGWKASWNGQPLQILRANRAFMAVILPPGVGNLEFNFTPEGFYLLAKISAISAIIVLILGVCVVGRWFFTKLRQPLLKASI